MGTLAKRGLTAMRQGKWQLLATGLAIAAALLLAAAGQPYRLSQWSSWAFFGMLALSFTLVWGHAGIFSFGQAAFFGLGAYSYGIAAVNLMPSTRETFSALALSAVLPSLLAAALGYFMFFGRVGDVYVAIITLAVTLGFQTLMSTEQASRITIGDARLGGFNGLSGLPPLMLPQAGGLTRPLSATEFFLFAVFLALLTTLVVWWVRRSSFGRISAGLRVNELRSELLGYDVRKYRVAMFMLSGAIAGIAGGGFAAWGSFVSPAVFSLQQAALVAIWVLVGGRRSLLGAFVGVVIVQSIGSTTTGPAEYTPFILGGLLILVILFLPSGVVPGLADLVRHLGTRVGAFSSRPQTESAVDPAEGFDFVVESLSPQPLTAMGIERSFGGVAVLRGVDLDVEAGALHCIIGPNGAGKSTLFHVIIGRYLPRRGSIRLADHDITRLRPDQRARLGLGIKLQVPSVFTELAVKENLWLAAYGLTKNRAAADARADAVLRWLKLEHKAQTSADALAHGEVQRLEIGMVLARGPSVLLLDEPTAGMTPSETRQTADLLTSLVSHVTILVVEHDMDFVRQLQTRVTVLHQGQVFARGSIEELQRDDAVLDIYLGRGGSHAHG